MKNFLCMLFPTLNSEFFFQFVDSRILVGTKCDLDKEGKRQVDKSDTEKLGVLF